MEPTTVTRAGKDRRVDRLLQSAEGVVHLGVAALLLLSSGVLLVAAVDQLLGIFDGLSSAAVAQDLDTLLPVFVLVEPRPVKAAEAVGAGAPFRDQLWAIAVLSGVVALPGLTAWLGRREEREPDEGARAS